MVDKLTTAMGMAGVGTTTKLQEISPAPPIGPTWDLTPSPAGGNGQFVIGNESPGTPTITKSFTVSGELEAEVRLYGAGGAADPAQPTWGGHGGRVRGIYKFVPGKTYYITCGGHGGTGPQAGGGGGASALWIEPQAAGVELLVAGGGGGGAGFSGGVPGSGKPVGQHPFYAANGPGVDPGPASPGWPNGTGESAGRVTPTTGGRAGTGRRTGEAGGDAPRGQGGRGTNVPEPSGAGGLSGYAAGGNGGIAPSDRGGGGGGGGYAGGGGGNNDSSGFGGGGGNGYTHPSVDTNVYVHPDNGLPEDAQAGVRSWPTTNKANGGIFWGDPSAYGTPGKGQGIVKIILKEDGTP
mgnify:CR=1 FL=1|tara:strand:+ start:2916 stop:3968 length:1053 start_codon:yes stop_codon:yes gene_type:complete